MANTDTLELVISQSRKDGVARVVSGESIRVVILPEETTSLANKPWSERSPAQKPATVHELTRRELQICKLVTRGCSNADIGESLGISEATVKRHLYNSYNKLGIDNRTQLSFLFLGRID